MVLGKKSEKYNASISSISFKALFVIIGCISIIITTVSELNLTTNSYSFFLPILYTILNVILLPSPSKVSVGYVILNIVWIIRYCILPGVNAIAGFTILNIEEKYLIIALIIMSLELIITFIAVRFYYFKYSNHKKHYRQDVKTEQFFVKNLDFKIVFMVLIISFIILIIDSNALSGFNFILNQDLNQNSSATYGYFTLFLNWTKYILTIYLVGLLSEKYNKSKSVANVYISLLIVIIALSFFQGATRNGILVEALAYLYVLVRLYPKHKRKITLTIISSISLILLSITIFRYYNFAMGSSVEKAGIKELASLLNIYFSGQHNVAIGVKMLELFSDQYTIQTIFKDLFGNTVIINRMVTDIPGTVYYFNYSFYSHTIWADQISPLITQSLALFKVFGLIVPIILVQFILKVDFLSKEEDHVIGVFLYTLIAAKLAFYSHGNITIIFTFIMNQGLPLYLIYIISKRMPRIKI